MRDASGKLPPCSSPQTRKAHLARELAPRLEEQQQLDGSGAGAGAGAGAGRLSEGDSQGTGFLSPTDNLPASGRRRGDAPVPPRRTTAGLKADAATLAPPPTALQPCPVVLCPWESCPSEGPAHGDHGVLVAFRPDTALMPKLLYQNSPPPLPPKKYAVPSMPPSEKDEARLPEPCRAHPSGPPQPGVGLTPELGSEVRTCTRGGRPSGPVGAAQGRPSSPAAGGAQANVGPPVPMRCQPGVAAGATCTSEPVSLTTYFSVDSCMTDTYRLKYHQRPKLCLPEHWGSYSEAAAAPGGGLGAPLPTVPGRTAPPSREGNLGCPAAGDQ